MIRQNQIIQIFEMTRLYRLYLNSPSSVRKIIEKKKI